MDLHSLRLLMGRSNLTVLERHLALAGEDVERADIAHSPVDNLLWTERPLGVVKHPRASLSLLVSQAGADLGQAHGIYSLGATRRHWDAELEGERAKALTSRQRVQQH